MGKRLSERQEVEKTSQIAMTLDPHTVTAAGPNHNTMGL